VARAIALILVCIQASEEGSEYMMHVGTDSATEYGVVQFTNVMLDAREDATQLFDVGSDDKGQQFTVSTHFQLWRCSPFCSESAQVVVNTAAPKPFE
jgi:predicted RNase H-related nuclease YkuK (DUF458 family)